MTIASPRRVPFDEAGAGIYLMLRNAGLSALRKEYGTDHIASVETGLARFDTDVIGFLLSVAAWRGDEPAKIDLDALDAMPLSLVIEKVRDAWSIALNGRRYDEQVAYIRAELDKLTKDVK